MARKSLNEPGHLLPQGAFRRGEIFTRERAIQPLEFTGERLTSATGGQVEIEHLHRYFLARELCRGRDVLDIAAGEGYGAALIAQVARSVVGVDIAPAVVAHAARAYARDNLRFLAGDVRAIPLATASIDVAVSFETIEHVAEQEAFAAEVRRVLRAGGIFIVSTPNRDIYSPPNSPANPFHVRELSKPEFVGLLEQVFPHVRYLQQRAMIGSAVVADDEMVGDRKLVTFERRGEHHFEACVGFPRPMYMLAIASAQPIDSLPSTLYIESGNLDVAASQLEEARKQIHQARIERDALAGRLEQASTMLAALRKEKETADTGKQINQARKEALEAEARALRTENEALRRRGQEHAETLQIEVARLWRSRSWRLLRPLRNSVNRLRSFGKEVQPGVQSAEEALRTVISIRQSLSWELTAPLRIAYRTIFGARLRREISNARHQATGISGAANRFAGQAMSKLFDPEWYLARNLDVASANLDPWRHYLEQGWREGRDPHPLFDAAFYISENPTVAAAGMNPLLHFLADGWRERRDPHPLFDLAFYLSENPDVAAAEVNPLLHYIEAGAAEGRNPHPTFDTSFYLSQLGDPSRCSNPLVHYLTIGRDQGLPTRRPIRDFLPATGVGERVAPAGTQVDVIIPVYRGLREAQACIASVHRSFRRIVPRVIVIDDHTPERELAAWLDERAGAGDFRLLRNSTNRGFVVSANRGMAEGKEEGRDVVLLNGDAEVPPGWLDRLAAHAYADQRIATVTPYSNNATICSYPSLKGGPLAAGATLYELDSACQAANAGRSVEIPTAVGFCMFIRRECLSEIGDFDESAFGRGYGEENDFCMRALERGWRHVLACDTFAYHKGEVSFGEQSPSREQGWQSLVRRWPNYPEAVARHIRQDPGRPFRFAVTAARWRTSGLPVVVLVSHEWGGGIEKHVCQLIDTFQRQAKFLLLTVKRSTLTLRLPQIPAHPTLSFLTSELEDVVALLRSFGPKRVHVHEWIGGDLDPKHLVDSLGLPFDYTVHDYFALCPQIMMIDAAGNYCGEPGIAGCNACIAARPSYGARDIVSWRNKHRWLFAEADRVICPSQDVANRLARYGVSGRVVIAPHESGHPAAVVSAATLKMNGRQPLRIAILGNLLPHKGRAVVLDCAQAALDAHASIEFHIIGSIPGLAANLKPRNLVVHGSYRDADLPAKLAAVAPHVVWFPARSPETYGYTLSAALSAGLPIVASRLGAFPERLAGRPLTWLVDWNATPAELLAVFARVRRVVGSSTPAHWQVQRQCGDFYSTCYLQPGAIPTTATEAPRELTR